MSVETKEKDTPTSYVSKHWVNKIFIDACSKLKIFYLQAMCRKLGQPDTGPKEELVLRVLDELHDRGHMEIMIGEMFSKAELQAYCDLHSMHYHPTHTKRADFAHKDLHIISSHESA